jgi:GNAT superfamily N-acetyltransferase
MDFQTWRQWLSWFGRSPGGFYCAVAAYDGDVVGAVGRVTVPMLVMGREVLGNIVIDLVVDPRLQRKGIAADLLLTTRAEMQRRNVSLSFGYANIHSRSAALRAGGSVLGSLTRYFLPKTLIGRLGLTIRHSNMQKTKGQFESTTKISASEKKDPAVQIESFEPTTGDFKFLPLANSSLGEIQIIRTASWVQWREIDRPGPSPRFLVARVDGKIVGYLVYSVRHVWGVSVGEIEDLVFQRNGREVVGHQLLNILTSVPHVDFWSSVATSGSIFAELLQISGFSHQAEGPTLSAALESDDLDRQVLSTPYLWHLTPSDVF